MRNFIALLSLSVSVAWAGSNDCNTASDLVNKLQLSSMNGRCQWSSNADSPLCSALEAQIENAEAQRRSACSHFSASPQPQIQDVGPPPSVDASPRTLSPDFGRSQPIFVLPPRRHSPPSIDNYCKMLSQLSILNIKKQSFFMSEEYYTKHINSLAAWATSVGLTEEMARTASTRATELTNRDALGLKQEAVDPHTRSEVLARYQDKVEADCLLEGSK